MIDLHLASVIATNMVDKSMDQTDRVIDLLRRALEHINELKEIISLQDQLIAQYKEVIEIKKI